ncbi:methyltransferase domain-containing protein [Candidatus Berkelbacteria bacterium]|nr:methyltransferase domain-containing protein [Candidatus Berkelbacteria bacterium]
MSDNKQTIDTYNKKAIEYIKSSPKFVDGKLKNWIDKNFAKLIPGKSKILELGSGSGKDADYIKSLGFDIELTDASKSFVEYLVRQGKNARLLNAITDEFGQIYDLIFANAVFLHFNKKELKIVLKKIFDSLNQNGLIAFSVKAGEGEEVTTRKLNAPRYFCYWSEPELKKVLTEIGFKEISIEITEDYRGKHKPDWLFVSAKK